MKNQIRVGMVSSQPFAHFDALSGTPAMVYRALKNIGLTIVDLGPEAYNYENDSLLTKAHRLVIKIINKYASSRIFLGNGYQKQINNAQQLSALTQERINAADVDIIVGVCISTCLYDLNTKIPIIYASDTTARLINTSYEKYMNRSKAYHQACDDIEKKALSKCTYFLPSSKCAVDSALNDYKVPANKIKLIEFGAHITSDNAVGERSSPNKSNLELSLVAIDPIRKRLEFCIEVAESLKKRGWNVTLNYIGSKHPATKGKKIVNWHGRLQLSKETDRKVHQAILQRSHWMILPSKAEAFGIAPCEAAHFGRPSIVSDVGGLPTVVKHNETGIVMPADASADEYAAYIEEISSDEVKYQAFSAAALERAQNTLSWSVWASKVKELITEIVEQPVQPIHQPTTESPRPTL